MKQRLAHQPTITAYYEERRQATKIPI